MNNASAISRSRLGARVGLSATLAVIVWGAAVPAHATSFTVRNNCSYTVYPGVFPAATFQNGGWTLAPGASSTFTVASGSIGRLWGRTGCNTATSPAQCTTGSCGGTGLACAGTTGQPNTSLFEWNINASGTDWYDVSYVDAVDNPIGVTITNGSCVSPASCSTSVLSSCPADLKSGSVCLSPCTRYNTDQFCCRGAFGTPSTCVVANWTASAQTYVNNLHTFCPREYSYAYDENAGGALQTCATGSSYTITFCPAGSGTPATNVALNKPATASSTESTAFPASLAFDANGGTRWSSAFSDPQWIRVDLGANHAVSRVVLRWETAFARAYQIQISGDGNTWTTIHSTTAGAGGVEDFSVTGTGRFVRMNGTARGTQWGYSLWEFEVYGTPQ